MFPRAKSADSRLDRVATREQREIPHWAWNDKTKDEYIKVHTANAILRIKPREALLPDRRPICEHHIRIRVEQILLAYVAQRMADSALLLLNRVEAKQYTLCRDRDGVDQFDIIGNRSETQSGGIEQRRPYRDPRAADDRPLPD